MREVAQSELFDAAVSSLEITDDTDQKLAQAALVLYVINGRFHGSSWSNWLGGDLFDSSLD